MRLSNAWLALAVFGCRDRAPETDTSATQSETGDTAETGVPGDPDWWRSAGEATVPVDPDAPFSVLREDLPLDELSSASLGRELFVGAWEVPPSGGGPLDGLGPLFNAEACADCHPGSGAPPLVDASGRVGAGVLFRLAQPGGAPDPTYGGQLQTHAASGVPAEGSATGAQVAAGAVALAGEDALALTRVGWSLADLGYGPLAAATQASARRAPHVAGAWLLDAVDEAVIAAAADPDDADGDGVSGRTAQLDSGLGRFGWKASQPDLAHQSAAAFSGDMGVTSALFPDATCTAAQTACLAAPSAGDPELSDAALDRVVAYLTALGVPARRDRSGAVQREGAALFASTGCAACHRPELVTREGVVFAAYTDLLLHDLGEALADAVGEGDAAPAEWRTPPLWGAGLIETQANAGFLHDGRAATLPEAIAWHGGEAAASRDAFAALGPAERAVLLDWLRAL